MTQVSMGRWPGFRGLASALAARAARAATAAARLSGATAALLAGTTAALLVGTTAALLAGAAAAQGGAPTPLADFAAGPGSGVYSYASTSPRTLVDLIDARRPRPPATAVGRLMLPPGEGKVPAVVLVHGSGGVYPALADFWGRRFNGLGVAAMVIDVFGPRGVDSTADDQGQVPFSADVADAFAALRMLASHPRIDASRVAVMGFSRGGAAAWRTAVNRIAAGSAPAGQRFAAHIAAYSAGCAGQLSVTVGPGVFGPAPLLFIHGDADDYTHASDCQDFARRIAAAGTPAEFVLLPGARHKFDMDAQGRVSLPRVQRTQPGCPVEFDVDALRFRDRRSGAALSTEQAQAINRETCQALGATVEGDRKAREAAAVAVDALLKRVFGL